MSEITAIRARIAALRGKRSEIERSITFVPLSEALDRVDAFVDDLAKHVAGDHFLTRFRERRIDFHTTPIGPDVRDDFRILAVAAWADPDRVKAKLRAAVEALYANERPMPLADANKQAASIDAELFNLEVDEERCIVDASVRGHFIPRRHDANARAILAAVAEPGGTDDGH